MRSTCLVFDGELTPLLTPDSEEPVESLLQAKRLLRLDGQIKSCGWGGADPSARDWLRGHARGVGAPFDSAAKAAKARADTRHIFQFQTGSCDRNRRSVPGRFALASMSLYVSTHEATE